MQPTSKTTVLQRGMPKEQRFLYCIHTIPNYFPISQHDLEMRKAHKEKDRQRKAELYVNNPEVRKKQQEKSRRHQAELYGNNPEGQRDKRALQHQRNKDKPSIDCLTQYSKDTQYKPIFSCFVCHTHHFRQQVTRMENLACMHGEAQRQYFLLFYSWQLREHLHTAGFKVGVHPMQDCPRGKQTTSNGRTELNGGT